MHIIKVPLIDTNLLILRYNNTLLNMTSFANYYNYREQLAGIAPMA